MVSYYDCDGEDEYCASYGHSGGTSTADAVELTVWMDVVVVVVALAAVAAV